MTLQEKTGIVVSENKPPLCGECLGFTVEFRGRRAHFQYKICSLKDEAGHLSEEETQEKLRIATLESQA